MRPADHDALPAAFHEPFLFPAADQAAHGVQRGSRHFGEVFAGEGDVYEHAGLNLSARVASQAEQRARDPLLHPLGDELAVAILDVPQPGRATNRRTLTARGA